MVLTGPTNLLKGHKILDILQKKAGFGNFLSDARYLDMKFTFFSYLRDIYVNILFIILSLPS